MNMTVLKFAQPIKLKKIVYLIRSASYSNPKLVVRFYRRGLVSFPQASAKRLGYQTPTFFSHKSFDIIIFVHFFILPFFLLYSSFLLMQ